ncbi:hypothetical protein [Roseateles sp.]|uniref:hypothetical protein n=1 Tax=Roseateles sp. TaxID=1971397 RepID=UPI0025D50C06|nr:hypothetical protein [Roseateles sp.]MBV8035191.1 hypothetical protein [Roseateles sp.]
MNLSHAFPAAKPKSYVGIGLVVALHLAGIYALSAGLIKPPTKPTETTILLPPLPDRQPEPERPQEPRLKADRPALASVPIPEVPLVNDWKEAPTISTEPLRGDPPTPTAGGNTGAGTSVAAARPQPDTGVRAPGAVCSVMPRPEVPAVNWSGEAVLQVLATVRGGRVVASEVRVAQGAPDGKARRALQRSVESALAGYQCQGDALFQQDFAFRID